MANIHELTEETLQDLRSGKIQFDELKDDFFIYYVSGPGGDDPQAEMEAGKALKLIVENICNFKQLVDKFKSIKDKESVDCSCLHALLSDHRRLLFRTLIENNLLAKDDLKYLLNKIDNEDELRHLCWNTPLIKHILTEFVLDKETVDRFRAVIENSWWSEYNIHTIFELITYHNKDNEEILKLNELGEKSYLLTDFELTGEQRNEVIELIQSNESAKNKLVQIIENHLEPDYDFESLIQYLKKSEKKNLMNI